jgi:hypothetical protein
MILAICFAVGLVAILCGCINAVGQVTVALLKYVVGPVAIILLVAGFLKYGL